MYLYEAGLSYLADDISPFASQWRALTTAGGSSSPRVQNEPVAYAIKLLHVCTTAEDTADNNNIVPGQFRNSAIVRSVRLGTGAEAAGRLGCFSPSSVDMHSAVDCQAAVVEFIRSNSVPVCRRKLHLRLAFIDCRPETHIFTATLSARDPLCSAVVVTRLTTIDLSLILISVCLFVKMRQKTDKERMNTDKQTNNQSRNSSRDEILERDIGDEI